MVIGIGDTGRGVLLIHRWRQVPAMGDGRFFFVGAHYVTQCGQKTAKGVTEVRRGARCKRCFALASPETVRPTRSGSSPARKKPR